MALKTTLGEAVKEVEYFLSAGINDRNAAHVKSAIECWGEHCHPSFQEAMDQIRTLEAGDKS